MQINGVEIQDTFAEAWELEVVRLVMTAVTEEIALGGANQFVGAAGSGELGSRINAGIERTALPQETPDGRPGVIMALTGTPKDREAYLKELSLRFHLATLIPTCAVFDFMPDGIAIRNANRAAELHLQYLDDLLDERRWLAGATFGIADIHAAAQISVADYLAGIDWGGHGSSKIWYSALKSRPTFRALLADRMEGIFPPADYDKLDF